MDSFIPSLDRTTRRAIAITTANFANLSVLLLVIFHAILQRGVWGGQKSAICNNWCENSNHCDHDMADRPPVQQIVNSWTNLIYFVLGIWPLAKEVNIANWSFFVGSTYVAVGSFVYHASLTSFWAKIDVAGMYTVLGCVIGHGIHAVTGLSWQYIFIPVLLFGLALPILLGLPIWILAPDNMMALLITIIVILNGTLVFARIYKIVKEPPRSSFIMPLLGKEEGLRQQISLKSQPKWLRVMGVVGYALIPGVLFGLAFLFWIKDKNKTWCNPQSLMQGHSAWHILTGLAMYRLWMYFENNRLADILAAGSTIRRFPRTQTWKVPFLEMSNSDDTEDTQQERRLTEIDFLDLEQL